MSDVTATTTAPTTTATITTTSAVYAVVGIQECWSANLVWHRRQAVWDTKNLTTNDCQHSYITSLDNQWNSALIIQSLASPEKSMNFRVKIPGSRKSGKILRDHWNCMEIIRIS